MKALKYYLLIIALILTSCSYRITSVKYSDSYIPKKNDLYYSLNKVILEVEIIYNKKVVTVYENGIPETGNPLYTVKGVVITPRNISDENEVYVARGKNISHKFFLKENIDFQFNPNGTLISVSADYTDELPETIESMVKSGVSIGKAVMTAGKASDDFLADLNISIKSTYTKLNNTIKKGDRAQTELVQKELDDLFKLLDIYNERNKTIEANTEIKFKVFVDPDAFEWDEKGRKTIELTAETDLFNPTLPKVRMLISSDLKSSTYKEGFHLGESFDSKTGEPVIPGIIYRIPKTNKLQVFAYYDEFEVGIAEHMLLLPQYGMYGCVPVSSKLFTNKKTELVFDQDNGMLTSYKTESGSSGARISKSMENTLTSLVDAITYLNYDLEVKELEHRKKIRELEAGLKDKETSELDSLKGAFELIKLKQDMNSFGNNEKSETEKLKEELEILKLKLEIEKLKGQ